MQQRHRVKTSATIDPDLLSAVDAYLACHPEADRSGVIDEAMIEQFDGPGRLRRNYGTGGRCGRPLR